MEPLGVPARIGFRIKVQQSTPVRAAALTADGIWHLGGHLLEAAGGGCALPSVGSGDDDWSSRLGEVSGRLWNRQDGSRLRFRTMHPMDTGLVPGIPAFYIETWRCLVSPGQRWPAFHYSSLSPRILSDAGSAGDGCRAPDWARQ